MRNCKLVRADLRNANMAGANLEGADVSGADLRGASTARRHADGRLMVSAQMTAPICGHADRGPGRQAAARTRRAAAGAAARHDLWAASTGAEGAPIDLSGYDMRTAPWLAGACLSAIRAERAVFFGLALDGTGLQAAQLEGADFRSCRLMRADLRGVNLKAARLTNADLRDCNLGPLILPGNRSIISMLDGAEMRHADLRGANLRRAVLRRADLSSANLTGAQLDGTIFEGAKLIGTIGARLVP